MLLKNAMKILEKYWYFTKRTFFYYSFFFNNIEMLTFTQYLINSGRLVNATTTISADIHFKLKSILRRTELNSMSKYHNGIVVRKNLFFLFIHRTLPIIPYNVIISDRANREVSWLYDRFNEKKGMHLLIFSVKSNTHYANKVNQ